jgi:hypothetical protein
MSDFEFPERRERDVESSSRAKFFAFGFLSGAVVCLAIFAFLVFGAREGKKATDELNRELREAEENLKEARRLLNKKP